MVKSSHLCRDLVDEAKKFHLRPDLRTQMHNERTRPRTGKTLNFVLHKISSVKLKCAHGNVMICYFCPAGCEEVLVVVGGFGHQQSPIDAVEKYDPKSGEWMSLPVSI